MIRTFTTTLVAATAVCASTIAAHGAVLVGNDISHFDRSQNGDSVNVFYTNHVAMPGDGTVDAVHVAYQGGSGSMQSFQLIQLRSTGVEGEYTIVNMSDVLDLTGYTVDEVAVLSLGTPWEVLAGDIFGFYGAGIPFETLDNVDWDSNEQPTYYQAGFTWTYNVGDTFSLSDLPQLPSPDFDRDYGYGVAFVVPEPAHGAILGVGALVLLRLRRR